MTHISTQPLITAGNHRISFGIFRTVDAGDESEDWTGLRVVDNNDRDFGGGIDASGDFEITRGFFTDSGGGGTDRERLTLGQREEWKQQKDQVRATSTKR